MSRMIPESWPSDLAEEIFKVGEHLAELFNPQEIDRGDGPGTECHLRIHRGSWNLLTGSLCYYDWDRENILASGWISAGCSMEEAAEISKMLLEEAKEREGGTIMKKATLRPTCAELAEEVYAYGQYLREFNPADITESDDPGGDIRLQVYKNEEYQIHTGDSSFDQDHRGYWGAAWVPAGITRQKSRAVARDLIKQVLDDIAMTAGREEKS